MSTMRRLRSGIEHWVQAVTGACLGTLLSVIGNVLHNAAYFGLTCASLMLVSQCAQEARSVVMNGNGRIWQS